MNNIILIGMPGSGKSTMGVLLAKAAGRQFLDVDLLIQEREGCLLQDILDSQGIPAFLEIEERVVRSIRCERHVIAPGGSAVCRPAAAEHLKSLGTVVYLQVSPEELTRRIQNMSTRGIASEPGQTLEDIMACRVPLYERYADIVLNCPDGQGLAETAQALFSRLREAGTV